MFAGPYINRNPVEQSHIFKRCAFAEDRVTQDGIVAGKESDAFFPAFDFIMEFHAREAVQIGYGPVCKEFMLPDSEVRSDQVEDFVFTTGGKRIPQPIPRFAVFRDHLLARQNRNGCDWTPPSTVITSKNVVRPLVEHFKEIPKLLDICLYWGRSSRITCLARAAA